MLSVKDLIDQITNGDYTFSKAPWELVSEEAKDFISKCLKKNSKERMTPAEALDHPFLVVTLITLGLWLMVE